MIGIMNPSTANLSDACHRLGIAIRHVPLSPLSPGMRVAGAVRPVVHRGSVDAFFAAMDIASPGDVLVIDDRGRRDQACNGDLTALEAQAFGMAGIVVFGSHRDTADLRAIGLPVFSLGACAVGPRALDASAEAVLTATENDVVFGDDDGVLFVGAADAERVIASARGIYEREHRQADLVRGGTSLHEQLRWPDYVEKSRQDPAYTFRRHLESLGGAIEV